MVEAVEEDVWKFLELFEGMETEELAMMRKVKNILACGKELTSQTTNTEAKKISQNLRVFIADLHNQVRRLINTQAIKEEDVVPFYNWLEERD